jgi:hypothetical protein
MKSSSRLAAVACAVVVAFALPGAASAAPAPFEGLPFECADLGSVILKAPGADGTAFTPAFIAGTNMLLVPYVVELTVSSSFGNTTVDATKAAPLPDGTITCTIDVTLHLGGVAYTLSGSLIGVVRGEP